MGCRRSWRRVRVERGIYLLPNGKYAVCCRRAGKLWYRTVGSDLELARLRRLLRMGGLGPKDAAAR